MLKECTKKKAFDLSPQWTKIVYTLLKFLGKPKYLTNTVAVRGVVGFSGQLAVHAFSILIPHVHCLNINISPMLASLDFQVFKHTYTHT